MAAAIEEDSFGSVNPHEATRLSLFDINMEKARVLNKVRDICDLLTLQHSSLDEY